MDFNYLKFVHDNWDVALWQMGNLRKQTTKLITFDYCVYLNANHETILSWAKQTQPSPVAAGLRSIECQATKLSSYVTMLAVNGTFQFNDNCNFLSLQMHTFFTTKVFFGFMVMDVNGLCQSEIILNWNIKIN